MLMLTRLEKREDTMAELLRRVRESGTNKALFLVSADEVVEVDGWDVTACECMCSTHYHFADRTTAGWTVDWPIYERTGKVMLVPFCQACLVELERERQATNDPNEPTPLWAMVFPGPAGGDNVIDYSAMDPSADSRY